MWQSKNENSFRVVEGQTSNRDHDYLPMIHNSVQNDRIIGKVNAIIKFILDENEGNLTLLHNLFYVAALIMFALCGVQVMRKTQIRDTNRESAWEKEIISKINMLRSDIEIIKDIKNKREKCSAFKPKAKEIKRKYDIKRMKNRWNNLPKSSKLFKPKQYICEVSKKRSNCLQE